MNEQTSDGACEARMIVNTELQELRVRTAALVRVRQATQDEIWIAEQKLRDLNSKHKECTESLNTLGHRAGQLLTELGALKG